MSDPALTNKTNRPFFFDPTTQRIRSFVTRAGRLSNAQERAIHELGPKYQIPFQKNHIRFPAVFGNDADVILEIGFGMGETTAQIAGSMPDKNFVGVEVHTPGVGSLLKLIGEQQLSNIRIIQHDAVEVIEQMISNDTLSGVHIFFPDPWHKARHNKRRLIQLPFIEKLAPCLKTGSYIHCATDWEPYAEQILEVLESSPSFENTAAGFSPRPDYRPETKFEKRGKRLGHGVWDIVFKKR